MPEREPSEFVKGTPPLLLVTDSELVTAGGVSVEGLVTNGAVELATRELVLDRGPLGALNGTDPVSTGIDSVKTLGAEVEMELPPSVCDSY